MESNDSERVELARRLGAERMNLSMRLSTPLDGFEFVALTTVHDEYNPEEGHVGPLRWYISFFDTSGCPVPMSSFDNESRDEALTFATQLGVPDGEWTNALGVPLTDNGSLPTGLVAKL